ncbi:dienelactone hydrolase family protein [Luteolibacter sp. LG18]|uniref:alpha/beta hydrolase n=1 Tax=Luteolibacter sp. LG18 TaxID=2819286 RepID=UPI002B2A38F2|nr:carboxylic ester hydrolase [Luteolibacter sp. LG18]
MKPEFLTERRAATAKRVNPQQGNTPFPFAIAASTPSRHLSIVNVPWPEWSACVAAAVSIAPGLRYARLRSFAGALILLAVMVTGTATWFLLPALLAVALTLRWKRPPAVAAAICLIAGSSAACWLFPEPAAPPLPGPHGVGTRTLEIPGDKDTPALMLQVWYPSDDGGPHPAFAPWLPDPALAPAFPFHRLAGAKSRAWNEAVLSTRQARYPVVFYEHAWMGHRAENVAQVEDLASRGFVVIAVDHPGQASRVRHPDGTITPGTLPSIPDLSTNEAAVDFEARADGYLASRERDLARVKQRLIADIIPEWKGHLTLDRVGVFGFSFGGTTALRLCARDPWFHAGADEDGFFLGTEAPLGAFLFLDDEMPAWLLHPPGPDETPERRLIRRSDALIRECMKEAGSQRHILNGTRHESFSDRIFLSPIPRLAKAGRRPAVELHHTIAVDLAELFGRELKPAGDSNE